jgi:hypothetical protein
MKYLLPAFIIVPLAAVLFSYHTRISKDGEWQDIRSAMHEARTFIKPGAHIGCPVDSNHVEAFYLCRYWLAPAIVTANAVQCDTQLVVLINDSRLQKAIHLPYGTDTLLDRRNAHIRYLLLKKRA